MADNDIAIEDISLATAIEQFSTNLNGSLISHEAFKVLKKHADRFPLSLSPFWCFEIPLYEDKKNADFLFCISDAYKCSQYFENTWPSYSKERICESSLHQGLMQFSVSWDQRKSLAFQNIVNIWLEYDYNNISQGNLTPNFFFAPEQGINHLTTVHIVNTVFKMISGKSVSGQTCKFLLECLRNLPEYGWVSQIGKMFARNDENIRLFIQQISCHEIADYLHKISYPYTHDDELNDLMKNCYLLADQVDLDIDITDTVGHAIGLECYFDHTQKALTFMKYLLEYGTCVSEKYKAICKYLKEIQIETGRDYQPFISHFKIIFHPQMAVKAKVYIGYVSNQVAQKIIRTKPI